MAKTTVAKNRRLKARRSIRPQPNGNRGNANGGGPAPALSVFSQRKSIEELAAEQGIRPTRLEDILGKGADLWESDQKFEQFVEDIYARRRQDLELEKR